MPPSPFLPLSFRLKTVAVEERQECRPSEFARDIASEFVRRVQGR